MALIIAAKEDFEVVCQEIAHLHLFCKICTQAQLSGDQISVIHRNDKLMCTNLTLSHKEGV